MNFQLIRDNAGLYAVCQAMASATEVALDTEFIRIRTFHPKLGLMQIYDGVHLVLIDPSAITDWTAFIAMMRAPYCVKYFHACSEDLDVFQHYFNYLPTPLIDTQILAAFLDNAVCTSYANLVAKYLGITLSKNETRTNWLGRPLSAQQCRYAAEDVYYLLPLAQQLLTQITHTPWRQAVDEECCAVLTRKSAKLLPENAYLSFKQLNQLHGNARAYLQLLAAWRLETARNQDIALNFVLPEATLCQIARYQPTSLAQLQQLGISGKGIRLYGQIILDLMRQPLSSPATIIKHPSEYSEYKSISHRFKKAAAIIATETGLNKEIILSRRHINQYVDWLHQPQCPTPELIKGWRVPLFKPYLSLPTKNH